MIDFHVPIVLGKHWALQMLANFVTLPWEVAGSGESIFVFVVGEIRFTHATGDHEEQPLRISHAHGQQSEAMTMRNPTSSFTSLGNQT